MRKMNSWRRSQEVEGQGGSSRHAASLRHTQQYCNHRLICQRSSLVGFRPSTDVCLVIFSRSGVRPKCRPPPPSRGPLAGVRCVGSGHADSSTGRAGSGVAARLAWEKAGRDRRALRPVGKINKGL